MATITVNGNAANLAGKEINIGDMAPIVKLADKDLKSITVGGKRDKIQILIAVPSLDTPVCATEAKKFNQNAANKDGVELTIISMDLPFAMKRFCSTEGIQNLQVGSDFRNKEFANSYGLLIKDGILEGLIARAVFVVDKNGKVIHKQIISEIANEPDYNAIQKDVIAYGGCDCSDECAIN